MTGSLLGTAGDDACALASLMSGLITQGMDMPFLFVNSTIVTISLGSPQSGRPRSIRAVLHAAGSQRTAPMLICESRK
jgi:hypothetical protein